MDIYTLLVAGFFFLTGVVVVVLIWILQSAVRRSRERTRAAAAGASNLSPVARLYRDTQSQDLVVEMDGQNYRTVHELSSTQQHRLSIASSVLTQWLVAPAPPPAPAEEPAAQPQAASQPEETLEAGETSIPGAPSPAEEARLPESLAIPEGVFLSETAAAPETSPSPEPGEAPPFEPPLIPDDAASAGLVQETELPAQGGEVVPPFAEAEEVKPVSTDISDVVGGILKPAAKPVPTIKSIASQINDILQAQLAGTTLESRGISLSDAPDHGVMVFLDGKSYLGLKEVPDEEVLQAIRAAVHEWETKK